MCNPISGILSQTECYMPDPSVWNHSHTAIAAHHSLRDGQLGDRLARFELRPPQDPPDYRSDQTTWTLIIDEQRKPAWYVEDEAANEDRIRKAVARWLAGVPDNIVPGYVGSVGEHGQIVGGERAKVAAGNEGTATAGNRGTATAGNGGTIIIKWYDGNRYRLAVGYVGEDGIEPDVAYRVVCGKLEAKR